MNLQETGKVNTLDKRLTVFSRAYILLHALIFVLGFSLVFIVGWGGATTILGQIFVQYKSWIARIGGLVLIVFGLATIGILHIPWFYMDTRPEFQGKPGTFFGSLMMGLFFAAGWSPCIGATLGAILTLGYSQDTVWQAMFLSSGYSIGLGIPFILLAVGLDSAMGWVRRLKKYLPVFQWISGLLIIAIGLLLIFNRMTVIAIWAQRNNFYFDVFSSSSAVPSYLTAVIAGALSFLSPCVLPLVPAYLGYLSGHAISAARSAE